MTPHSHTPRHQAGISLIPIIIGIGVFSIATVMFLNQGSGLFAASKGDAATSEISKLIKAAELYRTANGSYAAISVTNLAVSGYAISPITTGTGDNVYGLNSTVTAASGSTDATLTYVHDAASSCEQNEDRFTGADGVKGTPSCAGATLSITIE